MERYHELYRLCMAGAFGGLFLSGFLYIRLDIRTAVRVLTGGRRGRERLPKKEKRIRQRKKKIAAKPFLEEQTVWIKKDTEAFQVLEEVLLVHTEETIDPVSREDTKTSQEERMKRKKVAGIKKLLFWMCMGAGLRPSLQVQAEEETPPEVCLVSAVNDYGTTLSDEEGTFYFRESLKITLYLQEPKTEENGGEEEEPKEEEEEKGGTEEEAKEEEDKEEKDKGGTGEEPEEEDKGETEEEAKEEKEKRGTGEEPEEEENKGEIGEEVEEKKEAEEEGPEEREPEEETAKEKEEPEDQKEPWVLRRDGTELVCEDGYCQDLLLESGTYIYTLDRGTESVPVLTLCAEKYEEEPKASLQFDREPVTFDGVDCFCAPPKMTLEAEAACGIEKIEYRISEGPYLLLEELPEEDVYVFGGQSSLVLPFLEPELLEEGRHTCTFRVTDRLGGRVEETAVFLLDWTPPDGEVFVSYNSDGRNASAATLSGVRRLVSVFREWLFGRTRIDFSLYIKDGTSSGPEGAETSGIDWADLQTQIGTGDEKMQVKDLRLAEEGTAGFSMEGKDYRGYTKVTGCLMMPKGSGQELTDVLVIRRLKDRVGNVTAGEEGTGITGTAILCLDQKAPVLSVDIGCGIVNEERRQIFYREDAVLGLSIAEANYQEALDENGQILLPRVTITGPEGTTTGSEPWEEGERGMTSKICFPALEEAEAAYRFSVEYEDGAGNLLEEKGDFSEYTIVVDHRAPQLLEVLTEGETKYQKDGMKVYQNREGADVVISFVLEDAQAYWNPGQVRLEIYDRETKELVEAADGTRLSWQEDGDHHRAVFAFDGAGDQCAAAYELVLSYEDRAGNLLTGSGAWADAVTGGVYRGSAFWLDHEAPLLELTYSAASRLVQENDPDPEADETQAVPRPGYIAYYGGKAEVHFALQEAWACPVYEGTSLAGLKDFSLVVSGKEQGVLEPHVDWRQTREGYEGHFTLDQEDDYTFLLSYEDPAGNVLEAKSGTGLLVSAEGSYTSPVLVLDQTAPVLRASYTDASGAYVDRSSFLEREGCVYFSNPVYLKLEMEDQNLRYQEVKDVLRQLQVSDSASRLLEANSAIRYVEAVDGSQVIRGTGTWYVPLLTEGIYWLPIGAEDLAGNRAEWVWEEAAVDETKPELSLSYQTETSGFLDFLRYGDLTYLFTDQKVRVTASVSDRVSGIRSVKFLTEESDEGQREYEKMFSPAEKGEFQMVFPVSGEDFMGKVTVQVSDWSENQIEQTGGQIVESRQKHDRSKYLTITTRTAPGRTVGDQNYYNTDIRFQVQAEDRGSGLRRISVTGGTTVDQTTDYTKGAGEIVWQYTEEFLLEAAPNNENGVLVQAEYQDNAGHMHTAEQSYQIDLTPPKIQVAYDQNDPLEGRYYRQARTAFVTIQERNLDPADVEFQITGTGGGMPGIGAWTSSGAGDDTLHVCTVTFSEDGDYTFSLAVTDLAGNRTEYGQTDAFTIDQTAPALTVSFDQEQSPNGYYYRTGRRAGIEIREHNFDPSLVEVLIITAEDGAEVPLLSGWGVDNDTYRASVSFAEDGIYRMQITGSDLAGNPLEPYETEAFVIDQTPPKIEITGVEHQSANRQAVTPGVRCTDQNYDPKQTRIRLEGFRQGELAFQGTREEHMYGTECQMEDFAYTQEADDLYRLQVTACDLAGNQSEEEILFSVNRFGSVYTLEERTNLLAGDRGFYYTNQEQDLVVTETNVDALVFWEITCNRNGTLRTLTEGEDYTVLESGTGESWKQYVYTIDKSNFTEEGIYVLTIYSEDQARNVSDNSAKGKKLEFAVDKTAPVILLSGIEDGGQYREDSREITLDLEDNLCLLEMNAAVNGVSSTYYASELLESGGRIRLMAGSKNHWQTIQVTARDAAGNQAVTKVWRFLITPNLLVQFYMDKPLFYGMAGGLILAGIAGTAGWIFRKRKYQNRR